MILQFMEMLSSMLVILGFMYIGKVVLDAQMRYRYNTDVEVDLNGNMAIAVRRAGFYFAIAIAMIPSIQQNTTEMFQGLGIQIISGISILLFLFGAKWVTDKLILPNTNNSRELQHGNVSIGIVEASIYIATGMILNGSISSGGPLYSYLLFFVLAQIILLIIAKINLKINRNSEQRIGLNNISAGIMLAGNIFSYGLILQAVLRNPFTDIATQLNSFLAISILAIILMIMFANQAVDKIFLPQKPIKEEIDEDNYAALLMFVGLNISIAYVISNMVI